MSDAAIDDARVLLSASVLKQAKIDKLLEYSGSATGCRCLDVGGDNGVVSLFLRSAGGTWTSADGAADAVAAIRRLVGPQVTLIDGARLPFASASFDLVVVADYLEHVVDDAGLVRELARVIKPGGGLVLNVPHVKSASLLRHVRTLAGLTDEWHGHVRPGYRWPALRDLLDPYFTVEVHETYGRAFSEALDIALNAFRLRIAGRAPSGNKGPVVPVDEFRKETGARSTLRVLGPFMRAFVSLDHLLFMQSGYRLILRARRTAARAA